MIEIKTENDLQNAFSNLSKTARLEYCFSCKGCKKQIQNANSVNVLKKRYEKLGFENFLLCKSCATKLGKSKRTEEDRQKTNEKRKRTNLERYGVENFFKDKERIKKANLAKFGVENVSQLESVKNKKKETYLKKFGVENPSQSEAVQLKSQQTCLEKYGTKNPLASRSIQEKVKQTNLKKFGVEYHTQTEEFKQHLRDIWSDKKKREELSKKVSSSWSHKTAEELKEIQSKRHKCFEYQNEYFDSSWELAVWIWAKDHNMQIKREPICIPYTFNGIEHKYFPDFEIAGQLVEVKGDFFFKDDKMICPFDESKNDVYEAKHQVMLANNVQIWKSEKLKTILEYIENTYTSDFLKLFEINVEFPFSKLKGETDLDLIRYYHKSLNWATKKGKLSPFEAWKDKNLVLKSALNRLKYVHSCTPEDVIRGFSVAQIAPRVSVFKPVTAEYLIRKYLNDFSEIFDPFSGFSGRMLGTANCNKIYVGQDINEDHVKESNDIILHKDLKNCKVIQQDILQDIEQTHECLFTCPPYGGKEHWNKNNDEIEKSCDEWIDLCLKKYKCKKYLFVIDKTEKYKNSIVETLQRKTLYGDRKELVVLIES